MKYLHSDFNLGPENTVSVTLDRQANVRMLDDLNYSRYRSGQQHKYFGGLAQRSPFLLSPPHQGHWHVVVDLGGFNGSVRASINLLN